MEEDTNGSDYTFLLNLFPESQVTCRSNVFRFLIFFVLDDEFVGPTNDLSLTRCA